MPKKSITDDEIGLIKAMLSRGMKNRDIQFYFNRQDRPVNSGRITQIRGKTYGPEVPEASDFDLDAFLSSFKAVGIGVAVSNSSASPHLTLPERAKSLFEHRGRSGWFLDTHETERTECKETFCLKPEGRFADPLRSIAGLANNGGGFVFFGVKEQSDGSLQAVGLRDNTFAATDPAEINRCLAGALDPVPNFSIFSLDFDGHQVGVIHVSKHDHPPVIAIKNINNEVKEGAIYYRYVGETRVIKPGELRQIIAFREQRAVAEFAQSMTRVATGALATLDLDTGKVDGKSGSFLIDADLLPKIQFLREGDFREEKGAPALRLVGDVAAFTPGGTRTVRGNVTDESVLVNFLNYEHIQDPLQYILHAAHTGREWLPLFYYAQASSLPMTEIMEALQKEGASHPSKRDAAVRRLVATRSTAFQRPQGKARAVLENVIGRLSVIPAMQVDVAPMALAIQGIPDGSDIDVQELHKALLTAFDLTRGNSPKERAMRSYVYRAACRLDEIEYRLSASNLK